MHGRRKMLPGLLAAAAAVLAALIGAVAWLPARPPRRRLRPRLQGVPPVAGWVGRRELAELVSALTTRSGTAKAQTTGLTGAGGFGKTTLAARACQDRKVLRRFRDGIIWVTVGQDADDSALATRLSEIIQTLGGSGPAFTSLEHGSSALAEALERRKRTLLVADDVWTAAQLRPFAMAARDCRLLVTTRRPAVLHEIAAREIKVDALPAGVARRLLARDLPTPIPAELERNLARLTGGWPLLLNLVNRRLADDLQDGAGIDAAAGAAVRRLRLGGPAALDVTDSGMREDAVAATIGYSLERLDAAERERFLELGIFVEDAEVPVAIAALLWQGAAGLGEAASELLCDRLDGLSLLSLAWAGPRRVIVLHDVIRDYARSQLSPSRLATAHAALLSAARLRTMAAALPGSDDPGAGETEWWRLPTAPAPGYLWDYLTYHLQASGLDRELDQVCTDLRFLTTRLERSGPAAVQADLARSGSAIAARLRRVVAQDAHLLSQLPPPGALTTVFTSRLSDFPELADQLPALRACLHVWTAWPTWPLPELPSDTLLRPFSGHRGMVTGVAMSPDGIWLATASSDGTARTWNADGTPRTVLTGHTGSVTGVAIAPDGIWLATASSDGTARIWNADGTPRTVLTHHGLMVVVAIAPDGTWLATASSNGIIRTWNADGTPRATLTHHGLVGAVAIAPDGTWLATASYDQTTRTWNADGTRPPTASTAGTIRTWNADGTPRTVLSGHHSSVTGIAIAPDGTWLVTADSGGTARIWNADGTPQSAIRVDGRISGCMWSPAGNELYIACGRGLYRFALQAPNE